MFEIVKLYINIFNNFFFQNRLFIIILCDEEMMLAPVLTIM